MTVSSKPVADWDPRSETVLADQITAYDRMRHHCPVAHSEYLQWSVFRHEDVMRVLVEPRTFSNVVSSHRSVPNGMDPPEHGEYRRIIESYFSAARMNALEPVLRRIAADLIAGLPVNGEIDLMAEFAERYALQAQCAFLDWPESMQEQLRWWARKNHQASRSTDPAALAAVASEFDHCIRGVLAAARKTGANDGNDVVGSLLREQLGNRRLSDEEIISVLRNWTAGELGTIAACVGILAHYLAEQPRLQTLLREQPSLLPPAIDEILRIHAPLIASRRITTAAVELGSHRLAAGERVTLMWASANRDEAVFGDPNEFRLDRDPANNLLYGAGIHVCPGAPLARLELRVLLEELLDRTRRISLLAGKIPVKAHYPASGFSSLPLWIR